MSTNFQNLFQADSNFQSELYALLEHDEAVDSSSSNSQDNNTSKEISDPQPDPSFTTYKVGEHIYKNEGK